jgi:hypothetical protein
MKKRTREIAKTGIFGSKDDPQIVTERDLLEIAETFAEINTAPVVFGHWPNAESPRLGNVTAVSYIPETQILNADIDEDDVLSAAVDAGYYPDVSIRSKQRASDGKMYLVHLAYLGQEAPAIKDLEASIKEPLGIAASDTADTRAFPSPSEKQLYLSDTPPENFLNENKDDSPKSGAEPSASPADSSGAAGGGADSAQNPNEEKSTMTPEEEKKLREENERLKAEAQAKDLALSEASKEKRKSERERLKSVMNEKGVPKPIQDKALTLSDSLEDEKTITLSDSEAPDGKRTLSAHDLLAELMSGFPKPVELGKLDLSDGDNQPGNTGNVDFNKI